MEFVKGCLQTCWRILIRPTPLTFISEAEKGQNRFAPITGWLMGLGVYLAVVIGIVNQDAWMLVTLAISFSLIIPLTVILTTSVTHLVYQRVFHRKQYIYDQLLYITTGILFTFQIIAVPIYFALPENVATYLGYLVLAYEVILLSTALKHLGKLNYAQTISIMLVSGIASAVIFLCIGPFIVSMMGGVNSVF